jgi:hypothetical protein
MKLIDTLDYCHESHYSPTSGLLVCTRSLGHDGQHWDAVKDWNFL